MKFSLIFTLLISSLFASQDVVIEFREEYEGPSGLVYLGDIADIAGPQPIVESLEKTSLIYMPQPGRSKKLYINTLKTFKIKPVIDLERVAFKGSPVVKLINRGQLLKAELIKKLLLEFTQQNIQVVSDSLKLSIKSKVSDLHLPLGDYELGWKVLPSFDSKGQEGITLLVKQNGNIISKHRYHILIRHWDKVLATAKRLNHGHTIAEDDLQFVLKETTHDGRFYIKDIHEVLGKSLVRTLVPGRVLFHRELEAPTLVAAGQEIKLKVKLGSAFIEVAGVARENGAQNEIIRVINKHSKVQLQGKVVESGIVEVLN